jgi:superfamily I DNA and RNA helicase
MNETWWLDPSQLDDSQRAILVEPPETEMFISGPPGSGKTNILLLRANYVRSVAPRQRMLTFTRTLTEFLRSGRNVGRGDQIQPSEICTFMSFGRQLFVELGGTETAHTGNFDEDRRSLIADLGALIERQGTGKLLDVVFIDEVQSFLKGELEIIRKLSLRINAAGDARQRISEHREGISTVEAMVQKTVELTEHYRIGERICELADQIMPPRVGEAPLVEGCNYPEDERPSIVIPIRCDSEHDQFARCIETIKTQRRYIMDEPIGVIAVRTSTRDRFWEALGADKELAPIAILQSSDGYQPFGPDSLIRVMTTVSAQGSEFRAVHMLDAEHYPAKAKELAFTAVTRAKTELYLFHIDPLPGYLTPSTRELRSIDSIF